jgi:hypothetical protein
VAFSSCFFLAAVATATAPATPLSYMLFRRIQRAGLMLKGLSTAGRFVPAAGPSQAMVVTWHTPKAAPAALLFHGILHSSLVVCGGCNQDFVTREGQDKHAFSRVSCASSWSAPGLCGYSAHPAGRGSCHLDVLGFVAPLLACKLVVAHNGEHTASQDVIVDGPGGGAAPILVGTLVDLVSGRLSPARSAGSLGSCPVF